MRPCSAWVFDLLGLARSFHPRSHRDRCIGIGIADPDWYICHRSGRDSQCTRFCPCILCYPVKEFFPPRNYDEKHYDISIVSKINEVHRNDTHVQSYSFQRSMHSKGSWQITLAHGLFDGQFLSRFRAIVAWPHWVPFMAGGSGRCFPSNLISSKQPKIFIKNYKIINKFTLLCKKFKVEIIISFHEIKLILFLHFFRQRNYHQKL